MTGRAILLVWAIVVATLATGCSSPRMDQASRDLRRDLAGVQKGDVASSPYDPRPTTPVQHAKQPAPRSQPSNEAPQLRASEPTGLPPWLTDSAPHISQSAQLPLTSPADSPSIRLATERVQKAETPTIPEEPLIKALKCFRENHPTEAINHLRAYDVATREVLAVVLQFASRLGDRKLSRLRPRELATAVAALDEVAGVLRDSSPLTMETMCFCRTIERFGVYDPFPADHAFRAGVTGRPGDLVQVYVELKNFKVRENRVRENEVYFETALASTLVLRDYQEQLKWTQERPAHIERSRSWPHDCFLNCFFCIPPNLPAGRYVLWIHVKDMVGQDGAEPAPHRVTARSLDLVVRGDGEMLRP